MKKFNLPKVEVIAFQVEDIICVSGGEFKGENSSSFGDTIGGGNTGDNGGSDGPIILPDIVLG